MRDEYASWELCCHGAEEHAAAGETVRSLLNAEKVNNSKERSFVSYDPLPDEPPEPITIFKRAEMKKDTKKERKEKWEGDEISLAIYQPGNRY